MILRNENNSHVAYTITSLLSPFSISFFQFAAPNFTLPKQYISTIMIFIYSYMYIYIRRIYIRISQTIYSYEVQWFCIWLQFILMQTLHELSNLCNNKHKHNFNRKNLVHISKLLKFDIDKLDNFKNRFYLIYHYFFAKKCTFSLR